MLLAVQSVAAPPTTRVTLCHVGRRHQSNLPNETSLGQGDEYHSRRLQQRRKCWSQFVTAWMTDRCVVGISFGEQDLEDVDGVDVVTGCRLPGKC